MVGADPTSVLAVDSVKTRGVSNNSDRSAEDTAAPPSPLSSALDLEDEFFFEPKMESTKEDMMMRVCVLPLV